VREHLGVFHQLIAVGRVEGNALQCSWSPKKS
jgi:hypothetical protein